MQFRPNRKVMHVQLMLVLLFAFVPAAVLALPMLVLGAALPLVVTVVASVFAGLALLWIIGVLVHFPTIRYELDEHNLTNSAGLIWRVRRSTPLDKITNVDVRQGPVDRLLGVGKVWVFTPSTGALTPEAKLIGVEDPHGIRTQILEYSEAAKSAVMEATRGVGPSDRSGTERLLEDMLVTLKSIEAALKRGAPR